MQSVLRKRKWIQWLIWPGWKRLCAAQFVGVAAQLRRRAHLWSKCKIELSANYKLVVRWLEIQQPIISMLKSETSENNTRVQCFH